MRREFSKRTKLDIWECSKGFCEACGVKLGPHVGVHYDHIIPDAMGGEPTAENGQALCTNCHCVKTSKTDVLAIAKTKRVREKHFGMRDPKRGRPMAGTKASGWKHKISGEWERR